MNNRLFRVLAAGSLVGTGFSGIAQMPATHAAACASINFSQPGGKAFFPGDPLYSDPAYGTVPGAPATLPVPPGTPADQKAPNLDILGYTLTGDGGSLTATMSLGGPPGAVSTAFGGSYALQFEEGGKSYFVSLLVSPLPDSAVTPQFTYIAGAVGTGGYSGDSTVKVTGSVSGNTIKMSWPYGKVGVPGAVSSSGAYSSAWTGIPTVNLPALGLFYLTTNFGGDTAPEDSNVGAETGPGGQVLC